MVNIKKRIRTRSRAGTKNRAASVVREQADPVSGDLRSLVPNGAAWTSEDAGGAPAARPDRSGVLWITGFSASGKTTVGRKVEARLRALGLTTVFLDGDDLRSILGAKWGYTREERVELGYVYFRLCSHLASQGATVVIAAIAMYHELSEWMHTHIPHAVEVYLNVPEGERRRRDTSTKKIYAQIGNLSALYDEPRLADLVVDNFGGKAPEAVAGEIVDYYLAERSRAVDLGRTEFWKTYYPKQLAPVGPSAFAETVQAHWSRRSRVLDVGCGNGRDSAFFAREGHVVTGIDLSSSAIECCRAAHAALPVRFFRGSLALYERERPTECDVVYSRFLLHDLTLAEEVELWRAAAAVLKPGDLLQLECRSINDPMARLGKVISPTERIHGHYRRFLVLDELVRRVTEAGFVITDQVESAGLAVLGAEDPVVIRIEARKRDARA